MSHVSTRLLKNELSAWVHRAERGERITILRDGRPVAALVPLSDLPNRTQQNVLAELSSRGGVRLPLATFPALEPIDSAGPSASSMVSEDRR